LTRMPTARGMGRPFFRCSVVAEDTGQGDHQRDDRCLHIAV
jgi:hypothetical protein